MRGFEIRRGFQPDKAQHRGHGRTGSRLHERQGTRIADQATMIVCLVPLMRGSERRGLTGGDGTEQQQHEQISNPVVRPTPHG